MHEFFGQEHIKMLVNFDNKKPPINFFMGGFYLLYFTGIYLYYVILRDKHPWHTLRLQAHQNYLCC